MRLVLYVALAIGFYYALKRSFGNWMEPASASPNKYLAWIAGLSGAALILGTPYFGSRRPGSFFERADYEGQFFFYLFPGPDHTLSYRVPALVESVVSSETDQADQSHAWRDYWLHYAVMPNGGTIRFHDCNLKLHRLNRCVDDDLRSWGIHITSDAAH